MQQGMLFHSVFDPQAGFYVQQMVCRLREPLNVEAMQWAWDRVVRRHPILRTTFRWDVGEPTQHVKETLAIDFKKEDWRHKSTPKQKEDASRYLESDRQLGFGPDEPLMRLALFRLQEAEYELVWTFHHALLDGRSHHLVLKEVFAFYEAFGEEREAELETPRPYLDYVEWSQRRDVSKDEAFWRQKLAGFRLPTSLNMNSSVESGHGDFGLKELRLDEETTSALKSAADRQHLTLNTLVQGAWAIYLSRDGSDDIVFGTTRACRRSSLAGAESMVGMFINSVPMRIRVTRSMPLRECLGSLRQQSIEVRAHEHTPLLRIQMWSELPKGVPIFESIVVFESYELNESLALGGGWQNREVHLYEKANYAIAVTAYSSARLLLKIHYDRSRFQDSSIRNLLEELQALLKAFPAALARDLSCGDVVKQKPSGTLLAKSVGSSEELPS